MIQKTFSFGYLRFYKTTSGEICWKWTVGSKKDLERIAFLFSGNLILPKRQKPFLEWLEVGQSTNLFLKVSLEKPWTSKVSLKKGWLSGFIGAEACFYAKYRKSKSLNSKLGIEQKMVISQKDIKNGEEQIFETLLVLFQSTGKIYRFSRPHISNSAFIEIQLGSKKSQKIISDYLLTYPLRTIKRISFRKWHELYLYRTDGLFSSFSSSPEKTSFRMKKLVYSMNKHAKNLSK